MISRPETCLLSDFLGLTSGALETTLVGCSGLTLECGKRWEAASSDN